MHWQHIVIAICIVFAIILAVFYVLYRRTMRTYPKPDRRDPTQKPAFDEWDDDGLYMTWIGHSTMLIRMDGLTVLTDPVFSDRVGVKVPFGTIGPKRHVAPAIVPEDCPAVDVVILSHAHMDHFDVPSLRKLIKPSTEIVTAAGTGGLLRRFGAKRVHEVKSGQSVQLECGMRIFGQKVKHWGNRYPWNREMGYLGYVLLYARWRVFFAGDTAYTPDFKAVKPHRPQVACMPIGAYRPKTYQDAHCTPEEAWRMFQDTGAPYLVPMHHDTFVLSHEPVDEPMLRLVQAAGDKEEAIVIREHGETFFLREWPVPGRSVPAQS